MKQPTSGGYSAYTPSILGIPLSCMAENIETDNFQTYMVDEYVLSATATSLSNEATGTASRTEWEAGKGVVISELSSTYTGFVQQQECLYQ